MTSTSDGLPSLTLTPIGVLQCPQAERVDAPRQPAAAASLTGTITLLPGQHYEHALEDLAGWERIWVIFWLHRNSGWRPKVLPPRSDSGRKGVFATRSPHRPNPLGLSALRLERIEGLTLYVRDVDLLDGTPILDIKPYVAYTDAFADARSGWLAPPVDPTPAWTVLFAPLADLQLHWLAERMALALRERIIATLTLGPQPHPYRRIKKAGQGLLQLAIKDWRLLFTVHDRQITVQSVHSGYQATQLSSPRRVDDRALDVHRQFAAVWSTN